MAYLLPLMNALYPFTAHALTPGVLTPVSKKHSQAAVRLGKSVRLQQPLLEQVVALVRHHLRSKDHIYLKRPELANSVVIAPLDNGCKRVFISEHEALAHNGKQNVKITKVVMLSFDKKGRRLPKEKGIQKIVRLTFRAEDQQARSRLALMQELKDSSCFPHNFGFICKQNGKHEVYQERADSDLKQFETNQGELHHLPTPLKETISKTLVKAVSVLDSHGILHRDIKPANILVIKKPNGKHEIKLTDFGYGCRVGDQHLIQQNVGTPFWSSAEKIRNFFKAAPPTAASVQDDVWSVGAVIHLLYNQTLPVFMQTLDQIADDLYTQGRLTRTAILHTTQVRTEQEESEYRLLLEQFMLTNHNQEMLPAVLNSELQTASTRLQGSVNYLITALATPMYRPHVISSLNDLSRCMLQNRCLQIGIDEAARLVTTLQ